MRLIATVTVPHAIHRVVAPANATVIAVPTVVPPAIAVRPRTRIPCHVRMFHTLALGTAHDASEIPDPELDHVVNDTDVRPIAQTWRPRTELNRFHSSVHWIARVSYSAVYRNHKMMEAPAEEPPSCSAVGVHVLNIA